jgi:hypothetical protein
MAVKLKNLNMNLFGYFYIQFTDMSTLICFEQNQLNYYFLFLLIFKYLEL